MFIMRGLQKMNSLLLTDGNTTFCSFVFLMRWLKEMGQLKATRFLTREKI